MKSNSFRINTQKVVKVSNLTYIVALKVSVHICSLIFIGREVQEDIEEEVENIENPTKEGIHQLIATVYTSIRKYVNPRN